jgi:hypothetical protein
MVPAHVLALVDLRAQKDTKAITRTDSLRSNLGIL